MTQSSDHERIGLPPRVFFYTVDQIATILELPVDRVKKSLLFYEGRSVGIPPKSMLRAINIMPEGEKPEWRVSENALLGFLRYKGVRFYTRGYVL